MGEIWTVGPGQTKKLAPTVGLSVDSEERDERGAPKSVYFLLSSKGTGIGKN